MPIRELKLRTEEPDAQQLRTRLTSEWCNPDPAATQPIILEKRATRQDSLEVYVIWDDWSDLSGAERSELIVESFEDRYGKDRVQNLVVAMGLTTPEAERMGIK